MTNTEVESASESEIRRIQHIITPLAQKYGIQWVYLFGSYARGDFNENSDIDFRIDKGEVRGLQMAALLIDLEEALNKSVDLLSTKALDQTFLNAIKREERLIYEAG